MPLNSSICRHCGTPFTYQTSRSSGYYCSQSCHYAHRTKSPEERFWSRVEKTDSCWHWQGSTKANGYGTFRIHRNGKATAYQAHRFAYQLIHGPIPPATFVCHHCDNPGCVNPDHLFLGTHLDNMSDMRRKRRFPTGDAHPNTKLSNEQVIEIRQRYAAGGITQLKLAHEYGVSHGHINQLVNHGRRLVHQESE